MSNCPYAKVHSYQSLHRLLGQSGKRNYPDSASIHLFLKKQYIYKEKTPPFERGSY
jgi:hypothetical protein